MKKSKKTGLLPDLVNKKTDKHPKDLAPFEDSLALYLKEIARYPVLSKEEELKKAREFFKTKDPALARVLARSNLRFVVKIAAEYTRFGSQLIDLIQEGNMGLLQAIKEFNPYKGVRLITYAVWWIRGYIQEYLMRQHSLVRIGTNAKQRKLFYLLKKQQKELTHHMPDQQKLLTRAGFKRQEIQSMNARLQGRDLSLHQPVSRHNKDAPLLLDLQAAQGTSQEEELHTLQEDTLVREGVKKLKPHLNQKELFILEKRLLADSPLTLQEIGDKFSVSREAVRQMEDRLKKKLKATLQKNH